MGSFGAYLKQLREEKGLSREEVSSRTKIRLKYLTALEEDDLGGVPNEVFAKGFIRSYARCLAVEEHEVLSRFEEANAGYYHKKVEETKTEQQKKIHKKDLVRRKHVLMQWGTGLAVLALAVGLFIQNAIERRNRQMPDSLETKVQAPASSEQPPETQSVDPPIVQEEQASAATDRAVKILPTPLTINPPRPALSAASETDTPAKTPKKETSSDRLTLKVEAVEKGWVLVKIDDSVTKEVVLDPGEKVDWTARKQFRLSLENAGGVRVEFDGKRLEPLGPRGAVVKDVVLTRE